MDNQPPTKGDEKMCKTTTVNPNNARKGEIPDAWKKVRAIQRSFDMRAGGQDYIGYQFGAPCYRTRKYEASQDALGRYTTEGLKEMMAEAKEELRLFWHERFYGPRGTKLFAAEPYHWSERLAFAGFEFEYSDPGHPNRVEEYYPKEELVRLFVLLSDPDVGHGETQRLIQHTFGRISWSDENIKQGRLVDMLNPDTLAYLVHSVDGGHIAELLNESSRYNHDKNLGLVEKIVATFDSRCGWASQAERNLGDHLVRYPSSSLIGILRRARSEKAHAIADALIKRLEEARKWIQETLDALKGE